MVNEGLTQSRMARPIDSSIRYCFISRPGGVGMVYDWDGYRAKRLRLMRLATAFAIGLAVPVAITVWQLYLA